MTSKRSNEFKEFMELGLRPVLPDFQPREFWGDISPFLQEYQVIWPVTRQHEFSH